MFTHSIVTSSKIEDHAEKRAWPGAYDSDSGIRIPDLQGEIMNNAERVKENE